MVFLTALAGAGAGVEGVNGMDGAGDPSEDGIGGLLAIVCSIYNKVFLLYLVNKPYLAHASICGPGQTGDLFSAYDMV